MIIIKECILKYFLKHVLQDYKLFNLISIQHRQINRGRTYNSSATVVNALGVVPSTMVLSVQWEKDI